MPKEIIVQDGPLEFDGALPRPGQEQGLIEVSWHSGGEVCQVATYCRDALTKETTREATYYVDLNRRQINELIRHLRRARDQAYGRDE